MTSSGRTLRLLAGGKVSDPDLVPFIVATNSRRWRCQLRGLVHIPSHAARECQLAVASDSP